MAMKKAAGVILTVSNDETRHVLTLRLGPWPAGPHRLSPACNITLSSGPAEVRRIQDFFGFHVNKNVGHLRQCRHHFVFDLV